MVLDRYLENSEYIDWKHPFLVNKASELAECCTSDEQVIKRCFEFVRDSIQYSWDYKLNPVTCRATEVLLHGTGYCYAKSHLLVPIKVKASAFRRIDLSFQL